MKPSGTVLAVHFLGISSVVHRGLVLFGARDAVFYALAAATGREMWRFATGSQVICLESDEK